ncbi:hypothetical protein Aab01nite_77080 [Paractinoplanes abujensis]|nr:hypothetical protein Aab01nite_77080 [Actinoplanes abujensis]
MALISTAPPLVIHEGWRGLLVAVAAVLYAAYLLLGKRWPRLRRRRPVSPPRPGRLPSAPPEPAPPAPPSTGHEPERASPAPPSTGHGPEPTALPAERQPENATPPSRSGPVRKRE